MRRFSVPDAATAPGAVGLVTPADDFGRPGSGGWAGVAELLAGAGCRVSWLLTDVEGRWPGPCTDTWAERGVEVVPLPPPVVPLIHTGPGCARAHGVLGWLRHRRADAVCFADRGGAGCFAVAARRQGLDFGGTRMVVVVGRPTAWSLRVSGISDATVADLVEADHLERLAVAGADALILPHRELGVWLREAGWDLPSETAVVPHGLADSTAVEGPVEFRVRDAEDVHLATAALALAGAGGPQEVRFRLLGSGKRPTLEDLIAAQMRHCAARFCVVGRDEPGFACRAAVVLSEDEPAPHDGGAPLAVPEGLFADGAIRYPRHPAGLAIALATMMTVRPPARMPEAAVRAAWLEAIRGPERALTRLPAAPACAVSISVCITHHRRPHLLRQAVASVTAQIRPPEEVVVIDDGSGDPASEACLAELERDFAGRGWRVLRQENRYLGAARNAAATASRGQFLVFLDDDNLLRPNALESFLTVQAATDADVVTCFADLFEGDVPPGEDMPPLGRTVPAGGSVALGLFRNAYGDATALVRRTCFEALGGFGDERAVGHEDWEFFARAVLKRYRLEVAAASLLLYRRHAGPSMLRATSPTANRRRSLDPYLELVDPALLPLVLAARACGRTG